MAFWEKKSSLVILRWLENLKWTSSMTFHQEKFIEQTTVMYFQFDLKSFNVKKFSHANCKKSLITRLIISFFSLSGAHCLKHGIKVHLLLMLAQCIWQLSRPLQRAVERFFFKWRNLVQFREKKRKKKKSILPPCNVARVPKGYQGFSKVTKGWLP